MPPPPRPPSQSPQLTQTLWTPLTRKQLRVPRARAGSRQWLNGAVVPQLREGLQALVEHLVQERLQLAAGSRWEDGPQPGEGGEQGTLYLPHGWAPFQPLR